MYKKFLMLFLAFVVSGMIFISCSDDGGSTAPDPDITLTSLTGGDVVQMGSNVTITWEDYDGDSLKIELYKGGDQIAVIEAQYPNTGTYSYDVPTTLVAGIDYKIKISSTVNPNIFDFSDEDFTIVPVGDYIVVTSPNGGETVEAGTTQTITWEDNISEWVSIEVYYNGAYVSGTYTETPSDGAYEMYIPSDAVAGSLYKIKITSTNNVGLTDFSNDFFTVSVGAPKYITIISPNGGESWQAGTTQTIRWQDNIDEPVGILIYYDDTIVTGWETESDGFFDIEIPLDDEVVGDLYKIYISSVYDVNLYDISENSFSITAAPPTIHVEFPNGGESLIIGESYDIYWDDNIGGNVKIEFYENGTLIPEGTIDNAGNDGWYQLDIPIDAELMDGLTMKITSIGDPSIFDWSDGEFSIVTNEPHDLTIISSIPYTGTYGIDTIGEIDWYRVYLNSGKSYSFENTSTENFDSAFGLYFNNGESYIEVASDDDGGGNLQPLIEYSVVSSGYYYLKVGYFNDVKQVKK